MFKRIISLIVSVVVVITVVLAGICCSTIRNQQINSRLDELKKEAREIAYLAGQTTSISISGHLFSTAQSWQKYLNWKAAEVNNEFGAYILVVNRSGQVMDNMKTISSQDSALASSLNGKELSEALVKVLGGEEISLRTMVDGSPTFTVGVPFVQNDTVLGAVLIQTEVQYIESGIDTLMLQVVLFSLAVLVCAVVLTFLYVRSILKPLKQVTAAAKQMADGDFNARVEVTQGTPEVEELSRSFNTMADKISETESSRREFVANVSHELRSPITSISGFVQGMEDGTIPPEEHSHYLSIVGDETKRLSKLIGQLLALSRLERDDAALTETDFDICEMLRRAIIRRMNDLDSKRLNVVCDFDGDNVFVHGDSDRIEQVVVNLLDNALKFTPDGGQITLSVHDREGKEHITVADNGVGILPEDRGKVFDRFFTADRAHTSGKGTGLGLSICQRIMQMHGEQIYLEDTKEGSAFTFTMKKGASKEA